MHNNLSCVRFSESTAVALALLLEKEKKGKFEEGQSFNGVMTRRLDEKLIMLEIIKHIYARDERVSSFSLIMTDNDIPLHPHSESEIYVGGSGGIVIIDSPMRGRTHQAMRPNIFTVVDSGGSHGIVLNHGVRRTTFFGIKLFR